MVPGTLGGGDGSALSGSQGPARWWGPRLAAPKSPAWSRPCCKPTVELRQGANVSSKPCARVGHEPFKAAANARAHSQPAAGNRRPAQDPGYARDVQEA